MLLRHIMALDCPPDHPISNIVNVITTVNESFDYTDPSFHFVFSYCCTTEGKSFCIDCESVRKLGWARDNKLSTRYTACISSLGINYITMFAISGGQGIGNFTPLEVCIGLAHKTKEKIKIYSNAKNFIIGKFSHIINSLSL